MDDFRETLVGLFTEIAIVEHLMRSRVEANFSDRLAVSHFGLLNYFVRNHEGPDTVAGIAWSFQDPEDEVQARVDALVAAGFLAITPGIGNAAPLVSITDAGRARHEEALDAISPEITELVSEIPREDLDRAFRTLREIRLTLDNLPDR